MLYQQPTASLRRIGPIPAFDNTGAAVTGATFAGAGQKEISLAGAAFGVPSGSIGEIGSGWYYYEATLTEAGARPWIAIKLNGVCQETVYQEDVLLVESGIAVGETDATALAIGPIPLFDNAGVALTNLTGVNSAVSLNGAAWDTSPAGTVSMVDDGYAKYVADPTDAQSAGWIAVRLYGACQETVFVVPVVVTAADYGDGYADAFAAFTAAQTPTTSTIEVDDQPESIDHLTDALARLASQYQDDVDE